MEFRIGQGIDIHPFEEGKRCVLGGVEIPHHRGLKGHSDADALLHALVDAFLGATGRSDIGTLFPNTDPQWKNMDSCVFLEKVWNEIRSEGWAVSNIDCTVIAEEPRLMPHVPAMKRRIAEVLAISPDLIGIKATTAEGLGAMGRREGVFAGAVVLLHRQEKFAELKSFN